MDYTMSSLQSERRRNVSTGRADFMKMYDRKTKMPLLKSAENLEDRSEDDDHRESGVNTGSKSNSHSEASHSSVGRQPRRKQTSKNKNRGLTHSVSSGSSGDESGPGVSASKRPPYSRANIGWQPKHDHRDSRISNVTILCSNTSSSSSSEAESGAVRVKKNNLRADRGRQPRHKQAMNHHKRTRSESSSSSGSSDTDESSNNSYSRANIGWQPRHQLDSLSGKDSTIQSSSLGFSSDDTYKSESVPVLRKTGLHSGAKIGWQPDKDNRLMQLGSDSSDSSSSDSESLLSPLKSKFVRTLPGKPLPLAQRISSRNTLQSDVSTKRSALAKSVPQTDNQVDLSGAPLLKQHAQATLKPQALQGKVQRHRPHLGSGASSHGLPSGRNSQQHIPVKRQLNKESEQHPRNKRAKVLPTVSAQAESSHISGREPSSIKQELSGVRKTSKLLMADLFGQSSTDDDGEETEEDVKVEKEHEDAFNNKSKKTIHGTPADSISSQIIPDRAQRKKNQSTFNAHDTYSATQKVRGPALGRDDAVILVDITQSEERGALSGQASPKMNSVKPASSTKISERSSPVFPRHVPATVGPTRKQDNGSKSEGLVIRETLNTGTGSPSKKSQHVESPTDSHIVLRSHPEGPALNPPAVYSGKSHSNKESSHQCLTSPVQHPHPKLQPLGHGSASDLSSGMSRNKNTELLTSTRDSQRTGRSSRARASSSKQQASSINSPDHLHFPRTSFEENRYQWLLQTRGLVPGDVRPKPQQSQGEVGSLQGRTAGSGPKVSRGQRLELHDSVGSRTSGSSTSAIADQGHASSNLQSEDMLQDVGATNIKDGRDHRSRRPDVSSRTRGDPQPEVQVLQSSETSEDSYRLPLKIRRKQRTRQSSNRGRSVGNQGARQEADQGASGSRTATVGSTDSQPDVQVLESHDVEQRHGGKTPNRRRRRPREPVAERSESPDVVELVRQLDQDEAMAKQLQEQYDSELARITQQYSPSNNPGIYQPVMIHNVDNPAPAPPLPHLQPPPHPVPLPYYPQPAYPQGMGSFSHQPPAGPGREMTWRDDLMDLNAMNTAMMAQMGRFIEDNMEIMAGHQPYSRTRRGRGRGRGRSRGRGRRNNHMDEGNDYEALLNLAERVGPAVSKGLPESSINLLPTFLYTSGMDAGETECSICMGDYETGENMRRLPCFHFYHAACIDKWLKDNRICPVCREEVNFDPVNFM